MSDVSPNTSEQSGAMGLPWSKIAVFGLLACGIGLGIAYRDSLSLTSLAEREAELRAFQAEHPVAVYGIAFAIYVAVTGLSLPGAAALTLLVGWYFGLLHGVILVSFASTAGATVAFLFSRFLFRDAIQNKFGERLAWFNEQLDRDGPFFLFTLRLVPLVPFFVINAVMGLTRIKTFVFWWISQIGMLPGTIVYVFAGSSVPNLQTLANEGAAAAFPPSRLLQLTIAFALLGIFPLAVKFLLNRFRPATDMETPPLESQS